MRKTERQDRTASMKDTVWPLVIGLLVGILYGIWHYYEEKKAGHPLPCIGEGCPPPCYPPQEGIWPDCHDPQRR